MSHSTPSNETANVSTHPTDAPAVAGADGLGHVQVIDVGAIHETSKQRESGAEGRTLQKNVSRGRGGIGRFDLFRMFATTT